MLNCSAPGPKFFHLGSRFVIQPSVICQPGGRCTRLLDPTGTQAQRNRGYQGLRIRGSIIGCCRCRLVLGRRIKERAPLKMTLISTLQSWLEDNVFTEVQMQEDWLGRWKRPRGKTAPLFLLSSLKNTSTETSFSGYPKVSHATCSTLNTFPFPKACPPLSPASITYYRLQQPMLAASSTPKPPFPSSVICHSLPRLPLRSHPCLFLSTRCHHEPFPPRIQPAISFLFPLLIVIGDSFLKCNYFLFFKNIF